MLDYEQKRVRMEYFLRLILALSGGELNPLQLQYSAQSEPDRIGLTNPDYFHQFLSKLHKISQ